MNEPKHLKHLTETERHDAADGTLAPELAPEATEHLGGCEPCAADVARIKQLMTLIREAPAPVDAGDDLWPEIKSRIEREKVIHLASAPRPLVGRRRAWRWVAAGMAAAAMLLASLPLIRRGKAVQQPPSVVTLPLETRLVADSASAYEKEAQFLLNELELRRAMMPPQTRSSIDHDLKIIDQAILELKDAIANDPRNPALRRLLASSYKQKVDLLKRAGAAG